MDLAADAALAAWLFGGGSDAAPGTPRDERIPGGTSGLLKRLVETIGGDPAGPNERLDVGVTADSPSPPDAALSAIATVEAVSVRLSTDGTFATATNGLLIPAGTILRLSGVDTMRAASFLGTAAGAFVSIAYFG